jgi:hypothetical protein
LPEPEANPGTQQPPGKGLRNGREGRPKRHGFRWTCRPADRTAATTGAPDNPILLNLTVSWRHLCPPCRFDPGGFDFPDIVALNGVSRHASNIGYA